MTYNLMLLISHAFSTAETLRMKPLRTVSEKLISKVVTNYKEIDPSDVQKRVLAMNFMHGFEYKIKDLLLKFTKPTDTDNLPCNPQPTGHKPPSGSIRNTTKVSLASFRVVKKEDENHCIAV